MNFSADFDIRGGFRCVITNNSQWNGEIAYAENWNELDLHEVKYFIECYHDSWVS